MLQSTVDRDGSFRAEFLDYGLKQMDSGAVAISIRVKLLEWFGKYDANDEDAWQDFSGSGMEAEGDIWIVSGKDKGNKLLDRSIQSVVTCAGWDGDFNSIQNHTWEPTPCQVLVKSETYNNQTRRKIAFLGEWNRTPGGQLSNVDADKAKMLATIYGSKIRAIAGNTNRNGASPANRPAAPPPPPAPPSSNGHASPPVQAWMPDQAAIECANVGVSRETLMATCKARGFQSWNMLECTKIAKELIAAAMPEPSLSRNDNNGDIPF